MKLYLLKRDHHDGQTIYGVFQSEELALKQIAQLKEEMPRVPVNHYVVKELALDELVYIEAYEG